MKGYSTIWFFLPLCMLVTIHSLYTEPADCSRLRVIIPECSCESAVTNPSDIVINCRHLGLTSLPLIHGSYSGAIYVFTLAFNYIEDIPDNAFQGLAIERLDLTGNKLNNISDVAFRGLEPTLKVLKLTGDVASSSKAPFTATSNLTNLQELVLQSFNVANYFLEGPILFPFPNLLTLTLDNMGLVSVGDDAFRGLTSLKELILSNHPALLSYPTGAVNRMASTIETITVTQTGITALLYYQFEQMRVLKTLNMRFNRLNTLEDECFKGLENKLEYLDLSFNGLPTSQLVRLQVLEALKSLVLENIGLVGLSQDFLLNKPNLRELKLASNHLTNIPSNVFKNLTNLKTLDLSFNQTYKLADDSLNDLTSLESLLLDSQRLHGVSLTLPSLSGHTSLATLNLENTPLSPQIWDKISQAHSLVTLKMRGAGLLSIPSLSFRWLTNLANLDLSDNQIMQIKQDTFTGPEDTLTSLFLTNNRIFSFDSCTFYNYSSSLKLDLNGNPLQCDCSMYWLRKAIADGQISFITNFETCYYPPNFRAIQFTIKKPSDFCASPPAPSKCDVYSNAMSTIWVMSSTASPRVLLDVDGIRSTTSSITVSWTIDHPQDITHIVVVYTRTLGQGMASIKLNPSTTHYTIINLTPHTRYEICVEGHRAGDGHVVTQCIVHSTKSTDLIIG